MLPSLLLEPSPIYCSLFPHLSPSLCFMLALGTPSQIFLSSRIHRIVSPKPPQPYESSHFVYRDYLSNTLEEGQINA